MIEEPMVKEKLNVELYGQKYTFRATADEREKLMAVAEHVNQMMHKVGNGQRKLDYRDVAVLAAMYIAEEYYQLQQDYQALIDMIDEEK